MRDDELRAVFDQQAAGYDRQWAPMAPINACLYYLLDAVLADLPADARVLCVGVGTGKELAYLAERHPGWRFTAVEPSGAMLDICSSRMDEAGSASRCTFHEGYLDSLPEQAPHDAATCFLVSQFLLQPEARTAFFAAIAARLLPGGILASTDLASDTRSREYEALLQAWMNMMGAAGIPPEGQARMRAAYASDVAVLPPDEVAAIVAAGGFDVPARFFQAGLIHGWFSRRAPDRQA